MEGLGVLTVSDTRRLPGLDGLRAVAVLLVIFHHLCSQGTFRAWPGVARVLQQGSFGVQVFFVLSGFLITWLLLREQTRTGAIDLRRFYVRRSLRILPPALFYLTVIALLTASGWISVGRRDLVFSFLFIRNAFGDGGSPEVAHFWSLAVEEQFYLTWPFIVLFVHGPRRLAFTAAVVLLLAAWRATGLWHFGVTAAGAEALLLGCLLAQVRHAYPGALVIQSPRVRVLVLLSGVGVVALAVFAATPDLRDAGLVQSIAILGVAVVVNAVVDGKAGRASAFLDAAPVQWIGRLSYSLYLWQQLFCWSRLSGPNAEGAWPLLLAASFMCAATSYYMVEGPALAWRERLEGNALPAAAWTHPVHAREPSS